jgi:two-component system nitrate/nitrite response regulator NarL
MEAVRLERSGAEHGIFTSGSVPIFSDREQQILKDLAKGHSNKMIARTFTLADATVKVHIKSILRKTRFTNRTQVAVWALQNGHADEEAGNTLPLTA